MIKINEACKGIEVMKSAKGESIKIGDTVRITKPCKYNSIDSTEIYIGKVVIRRRQGVMIKLTGRKDYTTPAKFEKSGWIWDLIKTETT